MSDQEELANGSEEEVDEEEQELAGGDEEDDVEEVENEDQIGNDDEEEEDDVDVDESKIDTKEKNNKNEVQIITSEEIESLTKQLILAKVELTFLKKRKNLLLEEIHRQCLEGELDPKKRLKPYYDKRKKLKLSNDASHEKA